VVLDTALPPAASDPVGAPNVGAVEPQRRPVNGVEGPFATFLPSPSFEVTVRIAFSPTL